MKTHTKTEVEILEEISGSLQKLIGIAVTQGQSDETKILILQRMGFNSSQISEMTGIPEPTVRKKWQKKQIKKNSERKG